MRPRLTREQAARLLELWLLKWPEMRYYFSTDGLHVIGCQCQPCLDKRKTLH